MLAVGLVILLCGYAALRLGRWFWGYAWELGGDQVAMAILIRLVGYGLMLAGVILIVRQLVEAA